MHVFTRIVNNVSAVSFMCRKTIFKNEIGENKIAKSTKPSVTGIIVMNLNRKLMQFLYATHKFFVDKLKRLNPDIKINL